MRVMTGAAGGSRFIPQHTRIQPILDNNSDVISGHPAAIPQLPSNGPTGPCTIRVRAPQLYCPSRLDTGNRTARVRRCPRQNARRGLCAD